MSEGSSDINVDDPDFWQKWAEKAKLDLDELANKDSLVLDTPRQRRKVARYGNDNFEEIVDMSDAIDEVCWKRGRGREKERERERERERCKLVIRILYIRGVHVRCTKMQ